MPMSNGPVERQVHTVQNGGRRPARASALLDPQGGGDIQPRGPDLCDGE